MSRIVTIAEVKAGSVKYQAKIKGTYVLQPWFIYNAHRMALDGGWIQGTTFWLHDKRWTPSFNPTTAEFGLTLRSDEEHYARLAVGLDGASLPTMTDERQWFRKNRTVAFKIINDSEQVKQCIGENNELIIRMMIDEHTSPTTESGYSEKLKFANMFHELKN